MQAVHLDCQVQQKLPSGWQGGINLNRAPSAGPWRTADRRGEVERSPGKVSLRSGGLAAPIHYLSLLISRRLLGKTAPIHFLADAFLAKSCCFC